MDKIKTNITFISLFLLPSFVFVSIKASSLAIGMGIAMTIILAIHFYSVLEQKFKLSGILIFLCFSLVIFTSSAYFYLEDFKKPLLSFLPIITLIFAAYMNAQFFMRMDSDLLIKCIRGFILLLLSLGFLKLVYIPSFFGYSSLQKPVFPFSEESHYALSLGMLSVIYAFVGNIRWAIFILVSALMLAMSYPNLTLLIFCVLMVFAILARTSPLTFRLCAFVFFPLAIFTVIMLVSNIEYFSSRLNFNSYDNLTTLVFMQGWQLAYLNLVETGGLGLGFQMLGSEATFFGNFTHILINMTQHIDYILNSADGGFLAAKMIAEFGVIGLAVVVYYIYSLQRSVFEINRLSNQKITTDEHKKKILMHGIVISFFVEMLLRGYGYFSPGVFMVLSCFFARRLLLQSDAEPQYADHKNIMPSCA